MKIQAITLFPEMFQSITEYGVTGRAHKQGIWQFAAINPRQFADNKLGYIDDRPFGGGVGMVMMAEPLLKAIDLAKQNCSGSLNSSRVIYLSPQGAPLTHNKVKSLSELDNLILLCGRYEGVDERVLQHGVDEEISIGDFVVSGGELPAMMLMDAVLRLVPKVLGEIGLGRARFFCRWFVGLSTLHAPSSFSRHGGARGFDFGQSCFDCGLAVGTIAAPYFLAPTRFIGKARFTPTGNSTFAKNSKRKH